MEINCKLVQDLIPLYVEDLCSDYTKNIVEEHIAKCTDCKQTLDTLICQEKNSTDTQTSIRKMNPFKKIKKRNRIITISCILCTIIITSILCINFFLVGSTASTSEITVKNIEMLDEMTFILELSSNTDFKKIDTVGARGVGNAYFMSDGGNIYLQANLVLALPFRSKSDYKMTFGFDKETLGYDNIEAVYLIGNDRNDIQLIWQAK